MSNWNDGQLKLLGDLKKKLEQEEAVGKSLDRVVEKPSGTGTSQLDDLLLTLTGREEGIQYKIEEKWVSPQFGEIDKTLFKLAVNIGIGPRKMAIGLPRVPVGISTWLAVSVMVSRIAFSRDSILGHTTSGRQPLWILVASRERSIRDLYLSQRLRVSHQTFIVEQFPIFRFRRDGQIQAISLAQPNELSTPVLFYHFDILDFAKLSMAKKKIGLILTEISELDSRLSRTILDRLENLRASFDDPKTYVFFNSFDMPLRESLVSKGYKVVDVRPSIPVNPKVTAIPTVMSTFSRYYCTQQVALEVVDDGDGISQSLLECSRDLAQLNREIQSGECRVVLAKWWSIWRTLKDLAIPMNTYERYRMHAQGRGSMETLIDRISASGDRIVAPEGKILRAVAPAIRSRLRTVYLKLASVCPKAERFMSLLKSAESNSQKDVLFVLSERSQVEALREQLLFTDVELFEKDLLITHLAKAVSMARTGVLNKCVVSGIWAPWQSSILLAIGASNVVILVYPYEANLVEARIQEHLEECTALSRSTIEEKAYQPILTLSSEQTHLLKALKELSKEDKTPVQAPQWLNTEPQFAFDTLDDEDKMAEDETAGSLSIKFDDGSSVIVRPHSDMMLVTEEGVESVFADVLSEGDVVAIMRDDATRSIFHSVLERVNHLVKVDTKVVELWRSSVKKILFEDQPRGASRSVSSIIRSLQTLGCYRTGPTIRQWFKGITLAPSNIQDIQRVLELAGVTRSADIAKIVTREMNIIRLFNRDLGRHIIGQIKASVTKGKPLAGRLDFEINEAIEAIDYKTVVSKELIQ